MPKPVFPPGPEPGQIDSPAPKFPPRKPDSPQQSINCTNACRGVDHVPLLRFCALDSGVDFVAQQRVGKNKVLAVFPWGRKSNSQEYFQQFLLSAVPLLNSRNCHTREIGRNNPTSL